MIGPGQPGYNFTRASILANAPTGSGVYVLFTSETWVYVGEAGDIRARLIQHLDGDNACVTRLNPTGFQFELWPAHQRVARQDALIVQLHPACNRRLG